MLDKNYQCFIKSEKKAKRFWQLAMRCGYSWDGEFKCGGGPDRYWILGKGRLAFSSFVSVRYQRISLKKLTHRLLKSLFPVGSTVEITRKATDKEMRRVGLHWTNNMDNTVGEKAKVVEVYSNGDVQLEKGYCYPYKVLEPVPDEDEKKAPEGVFTAEATENMEITFESTKSIEELNETTIPIIRGRWLTYEGTDYYAIEKISEYYETLVKSNDYDVLFKDRRYRKPEHVDLTDNLACSRSILGPVWVSSWDDDCADRTIDVLVYICNNSAYKYKYSCINSRYLNATLATPDEIDKAQKNLEKH